MATLAFLLAAFLDPVQAGIVLAVILVHRGPLPVVAAGILAAVVSETIMVLAADDYMWGELIAPRVVSSLLQAAVLCWIVGFIRRAVGGIAAREVNHAPGNATATLGSRPAGDPLSPASRLAPWHMRAYVRRRIKKLHLR